MKELLYNFIFFPMPILWLMFFFLIFRRKKIYFFSKIVFLAMFLISLPIFINIIQFPLNSGAEKYKNNDNLSAVIVLTGGSYKDSNGKFYPSSASVKRVVLANDIAIKHNKPLIILGGGNNKDIISESILVSKVIKNDKLLLEEDSLNTYESARNLKDILIKNNIDIDSNLLIVTSSNHNLRTALTFRSQGYRIKIFDYYLLKKIDIQSFMPNYKSLLLFNKALYEYLGIIQYFILGHIKFS